MFPEFITESAHSSGQDPWTPVTGLAADALEQHLEGALRRHDHAALRVAGKRLLDAGLFKAACNALQAATRQDPALDPHTVFQIGLAHLSAGEEDAALQAFLDTGSHRSAGLADLSSAKNVKPVPESMEYVHFVRDLPLDENTILFESYHGSKIDCNPAAIYRKLRSMAKYDHLRFAWVVTGKTRVPQDVLEDTRVSLIARDTRLYRLQLASAKYLVSNVSFPNYFVRRDGC